MGLKLRRRALALVEKTWRWCLSPCYVWRIGVALLCAELVVNLVVVERVAYTEIDWLAYMQECEGVANGTRDYAELRGDTGPLVYPAGFVYLYSALRLLTSLGRDLRLAQHIFVGVYLLHLALALYLYAATRKVPPYALALHALSSYRMHSLYALRLFNDGPATLLLYAALALFVARKHLWASLVYSLAVSVKMNALLYAPALLLFYLCSLGAVRTLGHLALCAATQLLLALPFLLHSPLNYLRAAFDLARVFEHRWTVNYRFLPEPAFTSRAFHLGLLALHLALLGSFFPFALRCFRSHARLQSIRPRAQEQIRAENRRSELKHAVDLGKIDQLFLLPMFLCNFIGVACARSLHYQFYTWYFHSLPYLLWSTPYSTAVRLSLLAVIELCWNTYPSTALSSLTLHACHAAVLLGIYKTTKSSSSSCDTR